MKKTLLLIFIITLTGMGTLHAINITITPPRFDIPGATGTVDQELTSNINFEMARIFGELQWNINNQVRNIHDNPQHLIGAFANSSVFSSSGATQRAYGGYDIFALTLGPMLGFQPSSNPFSIVNEMNHLLTNLETDGDTGTGINTQIVNAQLGINTSRFLLENFYLGFRFGFMRLPAEAFSLNTFSVGMVGNYQLFRHRSPLARMALWRGISLGAGLIYQNTDFGMNLLLESDRRVINIGDNSVVIEMNPKLNLDFSINTFTIPIEAVTSIQLFNFMNLAFGLGADIAFGNASLNTSGTVDTNFINLPAGLSYTPAGMIVGMGGETNPSPFNPKILSGFGFNIGPVIIDIPFTYYPLDHGFNLGLTLGVIW